MHRRKTLILSVMLYVFVSCSQHQVVTTQEAGGMASLIDSFIHNKKPSSFGALFSETAFGERIKEASGNNLPPGFSAAINKQIRKNNLGGEIIDNTRQSGSYELVKQYEKNKVQHLIFRLYGEGGLNYHDFELIKQKGKVYIADVFVYITGENLSKSMADIGLSFENIPGMIDSNGKQSGQNIQEVKLLLAKGDFEKAKNVFEKLPAPLKKQKLFQILKLQIYSGLSGEEYAAALEEFEKMNADEPNMYLALLDVYYTRKEYDKALNTINKIDTLINTDPFLDYYRGLTYNLKADEGEARKCFERLYRYKPGFESGTLELIVNYLAAGDFDKAGPVIETYRNNPHFDQDLLDANLEIYPSGK
ncbi:MAG: hypothetical protein KF746_11035 [Chitinophagaceae bacterium]|nr:hypothetical protein [Chitinophagaceae bacterium]